MKRILLLILALALVFSLAACRMRYIDGLVTDTPPDVDVIDSENEDASRKAADEALKKSNEAEEKIREEGGRMADGRKDKSGELENDLQERMKEAM